MTVEADNINFCDRKLFANLMDLFGWQLKEFKTVGEIAVARADFYPVGYLLATSKKAVIICEGECLFLYRDEVYKDFDELYSIMGDKAYETFPEWEIRVEKQWAVKKNGQWVGAFSHLHEMPTRKQLRC